MLLEDLQGQRVGGGVRGGGVRGCIHVMGGLLFGRRVQFQVRQRRFSPEKRPVIDILEAVLIVRIFIRNSKACFYGEP